jgi:hypothetical protein
MDFLRTLKKRKPKQHVPAKVSAGSTVVGGLKRRAVQERGAKKSLKAG